MKVTAPADGRELSRLINKHHEEASGDPWGRIIHLIDTLSIPGRSARQ